MFYQTKPDSCASHKSFSCQIIFIQPYSIKRPTFSSLDGSMFYATTTYTGGGCVQPYRTMRACHIPTLSPNSPWKEFDGPDVLYVLYSPWCVRQSSANIHPLLPCRDGYEASSPRSCYHSWEHLARTNNLNFRIFISLASTQNRPSELILLLLLLLWGF